jgi:PAS domain S-box-containing protein
MDLVKRVFTRGDTVNFTLNYNTGKEKSTILAQDVFIVLDVIISAIKNADGKVINAICQHKDVTGQLKAREDLRRSEENFRNSLDSSPLGIRIVTREEELLYANKAILTLMGYSGIEELRTTPVKSRLTPESYLEYLKRVAARQAGELPPDNYEIAIVRKGGQVRNLAVTRKEVLWNNQRQFQVVYQDITEQKQAEAEIKELYEKEKAVRLELEEESKARGLFIDVLAHELRTPLTPMLSSVGLLQEITQSRLSKVESRLIANIYKSTLTMVERLEQLLEVASYSRGAFKLKIQSTDLKETISHVTGSFMSALEQSRQQLRVEMPDKLPLLEIDALRMEQVLTNLLSNAITYNPPGGHILFRVTLEESRLRVDIKDEGPGISPGEQKNLFKPYHRVLQDRKIPGLGLGLTVCKQIIEAHGGTIWVESQLGKGSTISFALPLGLPK